MKKKKVKQLAALGSRLPRSYRFVKEGSRISGVELRSLISKSKNKEYRKTSKDVDIEKFYILKTPGFVQINHLRKLKRHFNNNGDQGIYDYIDWLKRNNAYIDKLAKEMNLNVKSGKWKDWLDKILEGKASNIWKTFLMFFAAFFLAFDENIDYGEDDDEEDDE